MVAEASYKTSQYNQYNKPKEVKIIVIIGNTVMVYKLFNNINYSKLLSVTNCNNNGSKIGSWIINLKYNRICY
jgi:hypothetical protein